MISCMSNVFVEEGTKLQNTIALQKFASVYQGQKVDSIVSDFWTSLITATDKESSESFHINGQRVILVVLTIDRAREICSM